MTDSVNELALRDTYRLLELEGVDICRLLKDRLCLQLLVRRMLSQGYYCGKHGCQNTRRAANLIADE